SDELDRQLRDPDVGPNELEGTHREERGQRVRDRHSPAQRQAGGRTDERLLRDPHVDESRTKFLRDVANGRAIFSGHHDEVGVAFVDFEEPIFVGNLTIRMLDWTTASAPPWSSSMSAAASSVLNATNHRSDRRSRLARPLPRTVSATTTDGLPCSSGSRAKQRSIASKSWPS